MAAELTISCIKVSACLGCVRYLHPCGEDLKLYGTGQNLSQEG